MPRKPLADRICPVCFDRRELEIVNERCSLLEDVTSVSYASMYSASELSSIERVDDHAALEPASKGRSCALRRLDRRL